MKSEALCIPCVINQCQKICTEIGAESDLLLKVTKEAISLIPQFSLEEPPSLFTSRILFATYKRLGVFDPFEKTKKIQNEMARKLVERIKPLIEKSEDSLHTAIHYACAGNVIDCGPGAKLDLKNALSILNFKIDHYKKFKEKLRQSQTILYILDNAGEIEFDKLLAAELSSLDITFVVKEKPILNDITLADADEIELKRLGRVISTGSGFLGVNFSQGTKEFLDAYEKSDIIIAKGHANFESLVDGERDCFFILKIKCPVVGNKISELSGKKIDVGDSVFYYYPGVI